MQRITGLGLGENQTKRLKGEKNISDEQIRRRTRPRLRFGEGADLQSRYGGGAAANAARGAPSVE